LTFDPNTDDSTQLLRLGLSPWQVRSLYRYRARGGVFQRPTDFARLYGLTQKQYRELLPYIRIAADYRPASELVGDRRSEGRDGGSREYASNGNETPLQASASYPHKLSAGEHVVLNQADTTELKRVPGIGSYYARRIVSYGQRLGGYVSVEQLLEIDGFPEDALPFFQVNTDNVKKMNLNTLSFSKIRQHPYVNFYQARAINDHRRLKGPLNGIDDLRHLPDFPPETIERLRPYVTF
jgi:DNA uptake protein ComE-like DNA-binding protein